MYQGKEYFIFGRRTTGYFDIRTLDGTKVNKDSISYKKLRIQDIAKAYLKEARAIPHMNKFTCVLAQNYEIIKFVNGNLELDFTASLDKDTVWLTQKKWRNYLILSHKR